MATRVRKATRSDGRLRIHRLVAAMAVAAAAGSTTPLAASEQMVDVTEHAGIYRVTATFTVSESPRAALAALTDYPGIPRFMPEVEVSSVVERRADGALVEQAAIAKFLMFTKRVHLLLDITELPGLVRFHDRGGKSFVHYDGSWRVEALHGKTAVTYALAAQPAFDVPEFLLRRLLKRDAVRMIGRLRTEIAARAARPTAADCQGVACQ